MPYQYGQYGTNMTQYKLSGTIFSNCFKEPFKKKYVKLLIKGVEKHVLEVIHRKLFILSILTFPFFVLLACIQSSLLYSCKTKFFIIFTTSMSTAQTFTGCRGGLNLQKPIISFLLLGFNMTDETWVFQQDIDPKYTSELVLNG